jgi:threonine dehydrogenase-like Zn-dependent dehydrogenase
VTPLPTIRRVRAVVLGSAGEPGLADIDEPAGAGTLVRVLACGLCGSDLEKLVTHQVGLEGVAALLTDPPRDYLKAAVLP